MQLRAEELERHLARSLAPLYVIHGDEPLQSLEAADAIRAKARAEGYAEREVLAVERNFDWSLRRQSVAVLVEEADRAAHSSRQARHRGRGGDRAKLLGERP